jgi:hypothetical protein
MTTAPVVASSFSWKNLVTFAAGRLVAQLVAQTAFSAIKQAFGIYVPGLCQQRVWLEDLTPPEQQALGKLNALCQGKKVEWIVVSGMGDLSVPYAINAAVRGTPAIVLPRRVLLPREAPSFELNQFWVQHAICQIESNSFFWPRVVSLIAFIGVGILLFPTWSWNALFFAAPLQAVVHKILKTVKERSVFKKALEPLNPADLKKVREFLEKYNQRTQELNKIPSSLGELLDLQGEREVLNRFISDGAEKLAMIPLPQNG